MFVTDEIQERSPYWLSPGIDVPTREETLPGMCRAKGLFHICDEHAEGAFVPTAFFMRNSPTWRLDVLGDILLDIQQRRKHDAVAGVGVDQPLAAGVREQALGGDEQHVRVAPGEAGAFDTWPSAFRPPGCGPAAPPRA